uniref:Uncharacterized protein n=1 Tax=Acrobeloides nanus TaxID=290746 RepID=A0A914CWW0_9BILA
MRINYEPCLTLSTAILSNLQSKILDLSAGFPSWMLKYDTKNGFKTRWYSKPSSKNILLHAKSGLKFGYPVLLEI